MPVTRAPTALRERWGRSTTADRATVLAIVTVSVVVTASSWRHTVDDGDIVIRYITNLRAGHGWVWNVGALRNACTSTLHPLLVLLVSLLGVGVTAAAHLVGGAALVAAGLAAYLLLRRLQLPVAGVVAGVALPLLPLWRETWGLETPLLVALLLGHAASVAGGRTRWLTVAAVALTRPDGAVLAVTSAVRERRRSGRWPVAGLVGVALPVLAVAQVAVLRTGALLPASVGAKVDQGHTAGFHDAFPYLPELMRQLDLVDGGRTASWGILAAAAAGLVGCLLTRRTALVELAAAVALQTAVYAAAGAPGYYWYYVPFFCVVGLLCLAAVEIALHNAADVVRASHPRPSRTGRRPAPLVTRLAGGAALVAALVGYLPGVAIGVEPREASYVTAAAWLRQHGPVTSLGVGEVGVYGVVLPTVTVIDLIGLTTPTPYWQQCCTGSLFLHPPQWLLLHVQVGAEMVPGELAAITTLERQAHLTVDGSSRQPGVHVPAFWGVDAPIVADPAFVHDYRLVHAVVVAGAPAQAVVQRRPGV